MVNHKINHPWLSAYDEHVPERLDYPDITINQLFKQAVGAYQTNTFLRYFEKTYSYGTIEGFVEKFSYYLIQTGLKKGDRVGLALPNIPQFVIAFYAILACGGIVVAMNPRYTKMEFSNLIKKAGVDVFVGLESNQKIFQDLQAGDSFSQLILVDQTEPLGLTTTEKETGGENPGYISFSKIINSSIVLPDRKETKIIADDAAIFQFSGGTTGSPKPAIGTHKNIVANALQFSRWCNLQGGNEVILAAIPLYHVYGMVLALNMGIAIGAEIVLVDNPGNIENILLQIQTNKVTFYPGVPTMYHAINQNPKAKNKEYDLTSIKACISGSFTLHPTIKHGFEQITGGKLIEGYGLSEAPTATHCNPLYGENKTGSIGLPLPDVEAMIVDIETGHSEMGIGKVGELILRGPQVMKGYYLHPEETSKALRDGWLYTGDIAYMDTDGYFFLVDRKKSLIKVNGLQVWPNEVENVIKTHPGIKDCAVGGVPDHAQGERVICWVVLHEGELLISDAITAWVRDQLSPYKVPKEYIFTENLPRSGVGKVLRRKLIADYIEKADQ